jgi:ABC-type bacteriocin/lantibiotic exporter with double-glycine peptidase domain
MRRQLHEKAERNAETHSYLVEVMAGMQTVKAQNLEMRSRWQWQERYARYISAGFKTISTQTTAGSLSNFLNKLSSLLVLSHVRVSAIISHFTSVSSIFVVYVWKLNSYLLIFKGIGASKIDCIGLEM